MPFPLQERYINLLTDFGFKRVFGTELNKQLVIDFLNTLLPAEHHIQSVTYKSTENLGRISIDRKAIFDIAVASPVRTRRRASLLMRGSTERYSVS